ncbi:hypothetical protein OIU76_000871 [Salix suchowensis]|nr:hypothetical protein OIU76_000871 [Salix suchowensis]
MMIRAAADDVRFLQTTGMKEFNFNGRCDHEQMKNAEGCIVEIIGEKNLDHFFVGMKVYVTDEKELIMEPVLKWAGNPDITIAVKAFGLKATVQV